MKVYISGKITGLDPEIVRRNFDLSIESVKNLGFEPVSPYLKNGIPDDAVWQKHMVKDIELLFSCDAIYMQKNWRDSIGSRIEHYIAIETGMHVFYHAKLEGSNVRVNMIKDAIFEATGTTFDQYIIRSKNRDMYFKRLIFINECSRFAHIDNYSIANLVCRDENSVRTSKQKYEAERKFNKSFRAMAETVENLLTKCVSQ